MTGFKQTAYRAARTFVQAAAGYLAANAALISWEDTTALKKTVAGLLAAAIACGIAALMNLPKNGKGETDA